ncbi:hypothetical protein LWS67_05870 [Bacillus atrophaeus]|uniref:hypothetical protein n=1 Tax=Bacillus atrophaeus TaxID=1452 RepID=UPI001EFACEF2|nr:hypothetical protein [Bacillus atrophaeus]MCG8396133.1 hypothetical protein [Bacillus atrophaeus]
MKKPMPSKLLAFAIVLLIVMISSIFEIVKTSVDKKYITNKEKSEQEKAEAYVEEMKPKIEEEFL